MTWNYATIIEKVKDMAETRGLQLVSRKPTHPGEVLREEFMPDFGLSVAQLAQRLGVSRQSMNELVHERLGRLFGMSPQYWLNLQRNVDLWDSLDLNREAIERIEPLGWAAEG